MRILIAVLLAVLAAALPAQVRAESPAAATVAVQAVTPTGDGRARVSECSGVVIAPTLVLTAGHCLDGIAAPSQVAAFAYEGGKPKVPPLAVAAFARHPGHVSGWRQKAGDPETRREEIAADLALLRLASPAPVRPAVLSRNSAAAMARASGFSGVGAAAPGARSGRMKQGGLASVRITTGSGPQVAFATAGETVCSGDSGGPATARTADGGVEVWGVVAAVLRSSGGCGARIVITPVDPASAAFRNMSASVGSP